jgi:hypothetical protein
LAYIKYPSVKRLSSDPNQDIQCTMLKKTVLNGLNLSTFL